MLVPVYKVPSGSRDLLALPSKERKRSMQLTVTDVARMMDLSAVKTDTDLDAVQQLGDHAKRLDCFCSYVLPCYVTRLKAILEDAPSVLVGAAVGFPSGAHATATRPRSGARRSTAASPTDRTA